MNDTTTTWRLLCASRHRQYAEAAAHYGRSGDINSGLARHFGAAAAAAQHLREHAPSAALSGTAAAMPDILEAAISRWTWDKTLSRSPQPPACDRCYDLGLIQIFAFTRRTGLAISCRCSGRRFGIAKVTLPWR